MRRYDVLYPRLEWPLTVAPVVVLALMTALSPRPAGAETNGLATQDTSQPSEVQESKRSGSPAWEVAVKGGASLVLNGQSNALPHRIRYSIRGEFAYRVAERFQLGVEMIFPARFERNYRMLGAMINAKVALYEGAIYQVKMVGGFGLGTGPKILSSQLDTDLPVRLWYQTAMQHRWTLIRNLMHIGLDLSFENLSVISTNLAFQFHF